ncbi:hypothetical protein G9A89_002611 [Geosiphon pyriformis]|nr:hypothetical protein G9A89_002611 [Geosiphon pyriformis]
MLPRTFTLNTGAKIPSLALRATSNRSPTRTLGALNAGLELGLRHVVSEHLLGTEAIIGQAIEKSGIPRHELFITAKLWNTQHNDVASAFEQSLNNLGVDYIDLYLMQWPIAFRPGHDLYPKTNDGVLDCLLDSDFTTTWKQLENLLETKRVKAIGVGNCSRKKLEKLLKVAKVPPAVNETEIHPYLPQWDLLRFCEKKGIHLMSHTPTGLGPRKDLKHPPGVTEYLIKSPEIGKIAEKARLNSHQLLVAWALKRGTSAIIPAIEERRIRENWNEKNITDEIFNEISELGKSKMPQRYVTAPQFEIVFED